MGVLAVQVFPPKLRNLWGEWNLRVAVLISLSFQIFLISFASTRKRSGSLFIQAVVWSSYLLADWFAAFAVGLISSNQAQNCEKQGSSTVNDSLAAFWAPFLLLHLGGPDSITAFSLEDNELWLRQLLSLIIQVLAVGYVFTQSIPNAFWLPTIIILFVGSIKYAERTRALYLACFSNLSYALRAKPADPDVSNEEIAEEYFTPVAAAADQNQVSDLDPESGLNEQMEKEPLEEKEMIQRAYWSYRVFRGLIVSQKLSLRERTDSRKLFRALSGHEAFKVVEMELSFLYDALYTKMSALHHGFFWYILRFVCSCLLVAAFVLFAASYHQYHNNNNNNNKPEIDRFDVAVTYVLLIGAITLDLVSLVKLIFSSWTIVVLLECSRAASSSILAIQAPRQRVLENVTGFAAICRRYFIRKEWSSYMYQLNLISCCLKKPNELLQKAAEQFEVKDLLDKVRLTTKQEVDAGMKEFIFNKLKDKVLNSPSAQELEPRGKKILIDYGCVTSIQETLGDRYSYDISVLMWHIATDICFHHQSHHVTDSRSNIQDDGNRKRSKYLSDYLLYLLIMQPNMMSGVQGYANIRFQHTCNETRKILDKRSRSQSSRLKLVESNTSLEIEKLLLELELEMVELSVAAAEVAEAEIQIEESILCSVLSGSILLGSGLKKMVDENPEKTWEMMSKVWVELLCYGADNCPGQIYAQQLSQGGELLTFVWLIMAHLGFGLWKASQISYIY